MAKNYEAKVNFIIPRHEVGGRTLVGVQPGETLQGELILESKEDINCRGVWIEIECKETGNGTNSYTRVHESKIFEGALRKDEQISHQISFQIPLGMPLTYAGQYVRFQWVVRLRIDIPLWFDPREEFEFTVLPRLVRSKEEVFSRQKN